MKQEYDESLIHIFKKGGGLMNLLELMDIFMTLIVVMIS